VRGGSVDFLHHTFSVAVNSGLWFFKHCAIDIVINVLGSYAAGDKVEIF
jgi:hypothetical protein